MSQILFARSCLLPIFLLGCLLLSSRAWADAEEDFKQLNNRCWEQIRAGKLKEAERTALELKHMAEGPLRGNQKRLADVLSSLGTVYKDQGRHLQAEPLLKESLRVRRALLGNRHRDVATSLNQLGLLYNTQDRFAEAVACFEEAVEIYESLFGKEDERVATSLDNLGIVHEHQGHYNEAERLHKRALAITVNVLGTESPSTATSMNNLAVVYRNMSRFSEAEMLFQRSLGISERQLGPEHPEVATVLNNLGGLFNDWHQYGKAERYRKRALLIREKAYGPEHPCTATSLDSLGLVYGNQGRYAEAERLCRRALAIFENVQGKESWHAAITLDNLAYLNAEQRHYSKAEVLCKRSLVIQEKLFGPDNIAIVTPLMSLAGLYEATGRLGEARIILDRVIAIEKHCGEPPDECCTSYLHRARLSWKEKRRQEALADLRQAIQFAQLLRTRAGGSEYWREWGAKRYRPSFELMVSWQEELGNVAEAFEAIENNIGQSFLDQAATVGVDATEGMPEEDALKMKRRLSEQQSRMVKLERELRELGLRADLSADEREKRRKELSEEWKLARSRYWDTYIEIRNASPAYRLAAGKDRKSVTLKKVETWIDDQQALLLQYFLASDAVYVLVIPAKDKARLEKMALSKSQAQMLGIDAQSLNDERLGTLLCNDKRSGVLDRLRKADTPEAVQAVAPALAVLWQVLIPEKERKAIQAGKYKRLIVLPDGPMAKLPFETLVVEHGDHPKYLLDVGPAIEYAPSATILMNLAERQSGNAGSSSREKGMTGEATQRPHPSPLPEGEGTVEREPVLTVGDCRYGEPSQFNEKDVLAQLAPRARYGTLGGQLKSLPNSATEIRWVADVFGEKGTKVAWLRGDLATEAAVRFNAPGRRILHFACHGLVDESYGNLFGALALTPGPNSDDPADDGFLTLAEVYGMNLKGCELAILSACDTNVGPQQRGEGIWALSRGFLVAGSRRVVASNWLVDDEAAPNFVSYFTSIIAKAEKEGKTPDYAQAVHDAKLFLRRHQNKKWHNPYYWGTFVLIGPS